MSFKAIAAPRKFEMVQGRDLAPLAARCSAAANAAFAFGVILDDRLVFFPPMEVRVATFAARAMAKLPAFAPTRVRTRKPTRPPAHRTHPGCQSRRPTVTSLSFVSVLRTRASSHEICLGEPQASERSCSAPGLDQFKRKEGTISSRLCSQ